MSREDSSRARMLVVDDDERNRKLLEGYLTAEGYDVSTVADGYEALESARSAVPDVILLDVMMPGMNGFDVCRILKGHAKTRLCQVMLVTALDGASHRVEGLDGGADDYVTKPIRHDVLMAKVRSLLRARRLVVDLDRARATLASRNQQLEDLEQLKETLTQTLVHDLKNPLAALKGNLDLLLRSAEGKTHELIERCRGNSDRMQRMILNLLDVAGLEEGKMQVQVEALDTGVLVNSAVDEARGTAERRGVKLAAELGDVPAIVEADPSLMRRVLDNLLANAISHSPSGEVVTASVGVRAEGIEVAVADCGPGIPAELREQIFDKFTRLGNESGAAGMNRGLGLTFCRLAIEGHGGVIWVEDGAAGGSVFRVLLPASERARGQQPTLAASA